MTAEEIAAQLQQDGWTLTYTVRDPGGYGMEAVFEITVARQGRNAFTTTYTKGCGLRRWRERAALLGTWPLINGYWAADYHPGKRVSFSRPRLKALADCRPDQRERQRDVLNAFDRMTEAEPPTLVEAVAALVSDANCVRGGQSFAEFCEELGFSTDSIRARGTFDACRDTWAALLRSGADLDALTELLRDY